MTQLGLPNEKHIWLTNRIQNFYTRVKVSKMFNETIVREGLSCVLNKKFLMQSITVIKIYSILDIPFKKCLIEVVLLWNMVSLSTSVYIVHRQHTTISLYPPTDRVEWYWPVLQDIQSKKSFSRVWLISSPHALSKKTLFSLMSTTKDD